MDNIVAVEHSLPTEESLRQILSISYGINDVHSCQLLSSSLNDVYLCSTNLEKWVLRLSRVGRKKSWQLDNELSVLKYLDIVNFPVPRVVPTQTAGEYLKLRFPEGIRSGVLFEYIEGESLIPKLEDLKRFAEALGVLHTHLLAFKLDGKTLRLRKHPIQILGSAQAKLKASSTNIFGELTYKYFESVAQRAKHTIEEHFEKARYSIIHGDVQFHNTLLSLSTDKLYFIDFDECHVNCLEYDLASTLLYLHFMSNNEEVSSYFMDSYLSMFKNETPVCVELVNALVVVRLFWLLALNYELRGVMTPSLLSEQSIQSLHAKLIVWQDAKLA